MPRTADETISSQDITDDAERITLNHSTVWVAIAVPAP